MKTKMPLLVVMSAATLATVSCTFPSSRRTVRASQANVLQRVDTGIITSVREVTIEGQRTQLGMYGGGLMGGAAASGIGHGVGSAIATATGAVGGAVVGQASEEALTRKRAQEITVRLDDGSSVVITQQVESGLFQDGDRVRIINGGGEARVAMDTLPR
jgi:outer membrane lipoprotein SlyB